MDSGQKATAGSVGIVLAALAAFIGIDFAPPSVGKYTADQSTVIQLLGADEVYAAGGAQAAAMFAYGAAGSEPQAGAVPC